MALNITIQLSENVNHSNSDNKSKNINSIKNKLEKFTQASNSTEQWGEDFDLSSTAISHTTFNLQPDLTDDTVLMLSDSDEENWDFLCQDDDAVAVAAAAVDLQKLRQLLVSPDDNKNDNVDSENEISCSEGTTKQVESATLLKSLKRANLSRSKRQRFSKTPRKKRQSKTKPAFSFSPSISSRNSSTNSVNELEMRYDALYETIPQNINIDNNEDNKNDENDEHTTNNNTNNNTNTTDTSDTTDTTFTTDINITTDTNTTNTTNLELQTLERQIASTALETRDFVRGVKYYVKVRNRLICNVGIHLTELVYVFFVIVSLRSLLGEFHEAKDELCNSINTLVSWIKSSASTDQGLSLAVMEHVQCLRLRLARLFLDSGKEIQAVRELQSLLQLVKESECSHQKKTIKQMTINGWLAEAYLRCGALDECMKVLLDMKNTEVKYRHSKQESIKTNKTNKKSNKVKTNGNIATFGLFSQHSLHSLYEPKSPPLYAMIVIRCEIESKRFQTALGGIEALLQVLIHSIESPANYTSCTLQETYLLKATALTRLANMACTIALPLKVDVNWDIISLVDPTDSTTNSTTDSTTDSTSTHTYVDVHDVVHNATKCFQASKKEFKIDGNLYASLNCELNQLEMWMEYLFMPIVCHSATWIQKDQNNENNSQQTNNPNDMINSSSSSKNNSKNPTGFGSNICQDDVLSSILQCLEDTQNTCCPLQTIRCHLVMAEYSAIVENVSSEVAISYYESARDLFLEIYIDGLTCELISSSPLAYAQDIFSTLQGLVRFLLCATNASYIRQNSLMMDILLLVDIDISRRISNPLSSTQQNSIFAFHDAVNVLDVEVSKTKTNSKKKKKKKDKKVKKEKVRRDSVSTSNTLIDSKNIYGLLHSLHVSSSSFLRLQSMSKEKMQFDHTSICVKINQIMVNIRDQNRQPTIQTSFDSILQHELLQCDTTSEMGEPSEPSEILKQLRRTLYVLKVSSSALVFVTINTSKFHVVYMGGRCTPYWVNAKKQTTTTPPAVAIAATAIAMKKVRKHQPYRQVGLLSSCRRYLMLLLTSTKAQLDSGSQQHQNAWNFSEQSWKQFIHSWGYDIASSVNEMCQIAQEQELKDNFISHDTPDILQQQHTNSCCIGFFSKKPTVPSSFRSHVSSKSSPPVLVHLVASKSLMMLPFEDIINSSHCGSINNSGSSSSNSNIHRHHVTRSMSLMSMVNNIWSERKHLERSRKNSSVSKTTKTQTARTPQFIALSYKTTHPKLLKLCEKFRQFVCLRRLLSNLNHTVRVNTTNEWLLRHKVGIKEIQNKKDIQKTLRSNDKVTVVQAVQAVQKKEKKSFNLEEYIRHAGTHTTHLPFQTPVLKHGKSPDAKLSRKFSHLSILHVSPSIVVNGASVVSKIESAIKDRRTTYPILILTYGDLLEFGDPLLHLIGWIKDITLVFIPVVIYEESLAFLNQVQILREKCLLKDSNTQKKINKMIMKGKEKSSASLDKLRKKKELPIEWSTAASTLFASIQVLREKHRGMPIVAFNSPCR